MAEVIVKSVVFNFASIQNNPVFSSASNLCLVSFGVYGLNFTQGSLSDCHAVRTHVPSTYSLAFGTCGKSGGFFLFHP